jgi:histidine triad (HIT) family protein
MGDPASTCPFCGIIVGSDPADTVWSDEVAVAFLDRRPVFHGHTLVVPARHVVHLGDLPADQVGPYFRRVQLIAAIMPTALDAEGTFVAMNNVVSQSVPHLHTHVVPRRRGDGLRGFFWPRQRYVDEESEVVAGRLRFAVESFDVDTWLSGR